MNPWWGLLPLAGGAVLYASRQLRRRGLDRWLLPYVLQHQRRRSPRSDQPVHVLLCLADHFEPEVGEVPFSRAQQRVQRWVQDYPRLFGSFRDSDGRPPRHTFFYPIERYDPRLIEPLDSLCRQGYGEVEIHLHHDNDTAEGLRARLVEARQTLAGRHRQLARDRRTGKVRYGFIHGNWALDNSRPDGRWCGVNNELDVLRETGCYADFTLPSAPNPTQTRTINSIYYAVDDPCRPRSHETGVAVGTGPAPSNGLMLIQGPLLLDWGRRKWGLLPGIENGCLQGNQAPTRARLKLWLKARVQVPSRPDWFFVKLHTHGANEANQSVLLGEHMLRFHETLAAQARQAPHFRFHYVSAREMYNLACAAAAGWQGSVLDAVDFELLWNGMFHSPEPSPAQTAKGHLSRHSERTGCHRGRLG